MGVRGLVTLVENHRRIYRDVQFRDSRLLLDGCNLLYLLYFDSGLDQNHGGEYAAFEDLIEKFITALRDCRVAPYVVMDGGMDYTDKKLQTIALRTEDRLQRAGNAAAGGGQEDILPQLASIVFKQTLARLEVPVVQCYAEADQELAALAKEWQCPVLSKDSDFYVFDLPGGLLPLSHFQWKEVQQSGSKSYIPCKKYHTSSFCIYFNIERHLLPAFAALAGNDYVNLQRMESHQPIKWTRFCPKTSGRPSRLEGLLCWLKSFRRPQEAFEASLGLMGELSQKRKKELMEALILGMEEYQLPPSSLKRFFIHGTAPPYPVEEVAALVPDWIRVPLLQARLSSDVLDVLLLQRMSLSLSVEDASMPSSYLISRPLRQVMYGLLLGKGSQLQVDECDRDGHTVTLVPVQPVFTRVTRLLTLDSLDKAAPSQRLQVLLEALGVTEASLSVLPPPLRLPLAVTCYWLQRAKPPPDETLLKALLLGLSNGDALRHRAALQTRNQHLKRKPDLGVAYAFNQWQTCLKAAIQLNQLLSFPLPEPQIARLFEGTLVHHLVHRLRTGKLKLLIKYNHSRMNQYKTMLAVVRQFQAQEASARSVTQKTAASPPQRRQPVVDLTADLKQLFLQCEDDAEAELEVSSAVRAQEDLHLDDLVWVKTRYRAKERNNQCNNPELSRKQECRGLGIR